jgi:hypothetical protein
MALNSQEFNDQSKGTFAAACLSLDAISVQFDVWLLAADHLSH